MEHWLTTPDGTRIYVAERGWGPPLVLLHGIPEDHTTWNPIVSSLEKRARLWLPDLRGFGRSTRCAEATPISLGALVDDLELILQRCGIDAPVLLGHDAGGYVAMEYAHRHPDRVRGLILLNTTWRRVIPSGSLQMLLFGLPLAGPLLLRILGGRFADLALALGHAKPETLDPVHLDHCRAMTAQPETMRAIAELYAANRRTAISRWLAGRETPAPLDIPALILWGELDPFLHRDLASWLSELLPRAALERLPGTGHFPHQERPLRVGSTIAAFLDRLQSAYPHSVAPAFDARNEARSPTVATEA